MLCNQLQQALHGFFLGNVLGDTFLLLVERNLATTGTYIARVGIGHLAGTVDYAAHDAYLQTHQMAGGCLDAGDGFLQVIQGASAAWAGDIFGLGELDASGLKNGIRKLRELFN